MDRLKVSFPLELCKEWMKGRETVVYQAPFSLDKNGDQDVELDALMTLKLTKSNNVDMIEVMIDFQKSVTHINKGLFCVASKFEQIEEIRNDRSQRQSEEVRNDRPQCQTQDEGSIIKTESKKDCDDEHQKVLESKEIEIDVNKKIILKDSMHEISDNLSSRNRTPSTCSKEVHNVSVDVAQDAYRPKRKRGKPVKLKDYVSDTDLTKPREDKSYSFNGKDSKEKSNPGINLKEQAKVNTAKALAVINKFVESSSSQGDSGIKVAQPGHKINVQINLVGPPIVTTMAATASKTDVPMLSSQGQMKTEETDLKQIQSNIHVSEAIT